MAISTTSYSASHTWKEIISQGQVWQDVLRSLSQSQLVADVLKQTKARNRWIFVGCGTSFYLAEAAAFTWMSLTGQPARALPGSEVLLYPELLRAEGAGAQAVVISRSGKTSEAVRAASVLRRELDIPALGVTCAEHSELERACDMAIVLREADEKSTVMTRSFTSMLVTLQFLAARRAGNTEFADQLGLVSEYFAPQILSIAERVDAFVDANSFADYVFLGQGAFHGIAREAALKIMEMSCSYSQFFHALEFRHGPKAIVSPETCLTFFLGENGYKAEAEVLSEMKDLGGAVFAVSNHANAEVKSKADLLVELNIPANQLALLAPSVVPAQLLGFFTGVSKGLNPDAPKNLTRVVMLD